jgi:hypothetical protein
MTDFWESWVPDATRKEFVAETHHMLRVSIDGDPAFSVVFFPHQH